MRWATERQIGNYQDYAQVRAIPVFVVIGLGGRPDDPDEVFIVPLEKLRLPNTSAEYLDRFRRKVDVNRNFYYDPNFFELR